MESWMVITGLLGAAVGAILFLRLIGDEVTVFERTLRFHRQLEVERRSREQAPSEAAG
ncbi:MAG: hypothetical protein GY778_32005 [bacterium]|nr:hypothetical protein [bacterium]